MTFILTLGTYLGESCWLEGTKEELTIKFIEDIVDDEDYSYYLLLDKFLVELYDGIYITNWLNKT